jgi:hypothetical protein
MSSWQKIGWAITRRILGEVAIPALCGIAWGVIAYYQGKTPFESISTGFAAFFFIFFLQGQVLRVAKNVSDKQNADEWRSSFASLKEGLDELRKQPHIPPTEPPVVPEPPGPWAGLIGEAHASLENQNYYAAVLAAAAAFEQAVRKCAVTDNIEPKVPLSQLVRSIAYAAKDKYAQDRLLTLVRLRNNLMHPNQEVSQLSAQETTELLDGFEDGIYLLDHLSLKIPDWARQQLFGTKP